MKVKKVDTMKVGDKIYSAWWNLKISNIEEYPIIGVEDDVVIVKDKVYKSDIRIKLSDLNKKSKCFFTTFEKAVDNMEYRIEKCIKHQEKKLERYPDNQKNIDFFVNLEKKFKKDKSRLGL